MAIHKGIRIYQYLEDWLVRARSHQACLQHTQNLVEICQKLGWLVNADKSELDPKQIFDFVGYQFDLKAGRVDLLQTGGRAFRTKYWKYCYYRPVHVSDRFTNSHRKASSPRPATHETHTVASQKPLENTRITRKGDPNPQFPAPSFTMVATGRQHSHRPTITPNKTCSANLYRRIKRRVGRSLKRAHCQRDLVTARKQAAYKLFGTKGSVSSLKRVPKPLCRQNSSCGNRQHYSSVIHKQRRRHKVGHTLCPTMENLDLVYQTSSNSKKLDTFRAG